MPFTDAQLATGANYALATYQKKEPIDQVNFQHALLDWLLKHKKESSFTGGSFKEPLFIENGSNAQNYFGADQVTYNERDPVRWTDFAHYNLHSGFWFDEDRLLAAGIQMSNDRNSVPTAAEKEALTDLLKQSYRGDKAGMHEHLAFEMYRDGSQSAKACPGLEHIVDWTPTTGTVGGIDASTKTWWQNNAKLGITAANVVDEMETLVKNCMRYGGMRPTAYFCGLAFHDNLRKYSNQMVNRQIQNGGNLKGGVTVDAGTNSLFFNGVPVIWDPTLDALDTLLSTTTRSKTCYALNDEAISFRPVRGQWMVEGKPEKLPDRYVWYFGRKAKYSLTTNKRNALGVIQLT